MSNQRRNSVSSSFVRCWIAFSLLSASSGAWAQFSRDGNRWYEVEISIFSHASIPSAHPEETLPERVSLGYPERLRTLESPLEALAFDFEAPDPVPPAPRFPELLETPRPVAGPPPAPAPRDFRLPDFNSDPYLRVEDRAGQFGRHNDRLRRSPEHRLLYHAVWRQPVFNRPQAEAILVTGGDRHGRHHELEGSVMFSFNVNRIDLDARLWLSNFEQVMPGWSIPLESGETEASSGWALPEVPFSEADESPESGPAVAGSGRNGPALEDRRYQPFSARGRGFRSALVPVDTVTELAYLEQRRSMISNQLHYLDHPDFGILVEVRPYELPDPLAEDDLP